MFFMGFLLLFELFELFDTTTARSAAGFFQSCLGSNQQTTSWAKNVAEQKWKELANWPFKAIVQHQHDQGSLRLVQQPQFLLVLHGPTGTPCPSR